MRTSPQPSAARHARAERTLASLEATLISAAGRVPPDVVRDARTLLAARDHLLTSLRSAAEIGPPGDEGQDSRRLSPGPGPARRGRRLSFRTSRVICRGRRRRSARSCRRCATLPGMLRSFSYAASCGPASRARPRPVRSNRAPHALGRRRGRRTRALAFLQSYFATGGAASALPADTEARDGYLRFFMIDRAVRELDGELQQSRSNGSASRSAGLWICSALR